MNQSTFPVTTVWAEVKCFKEKVLNVLDNLHSTLDHSDAIILTDDGGCFQVHRCILSAASTYFRSLFAGPVSISANDSRDSPPFEVTVSWVSSESMSSVLEFVYSGVLPLTEQNLEELLRVSDRMLLPDAVRQCEKFVSGRMTTENCVGIYLLSHRYFCLDLRAESRSYFLRRNHAISKSEEFLSLLPVEELEDLLRDDELSVQREDKVFPIITAWVLFDRQHRQIHFQRLAHTARIGRCRLKFLEHLLASHELVTADEGVVTHVKDMIHRLSGGGDDAMMVPCDDYYFRPRTPSKVIFAVGGWSRSRAVAHMEIFNVRTNRWTVSQHADSRTRSYYGLAVLGPHIYCIGGHNGHSYDRSVRRFDLGSSEWREMACLTTARNYVSAVAYRGCVYAIGGYDGQERLSSCERYDPRRDRWKADGEMNCRRSDAAAAVYKSHIFVTGGFDGDTWLESVEMYGSNLRTWILVSTLTGPRGSHGLFVHRGHLYAVGGYDGNERLNTLDKYDADTKEWSQVFEMKSGRSNFSVAVMEGHVYLIGGYDGVRTLNTVETLKEDEGKWKQNFKASNMNLPRSGLAVCVLESSSLKIKDYINDR